MKIYVDADGCPVVDIAINLAKEYNLEIIVVKNYAHIIHDDYASIVTVDISRDSADYYIVNKAQKGDIVISQDYGFAAMALSKGAICITQNGLVISSENIDAILNSRHFNQKLRREQKIYTKMKKRSPMANIQFENNLRDLINSLLK
ncbi:DUF188 domain-containing protein [Tissierella sp.]|uniref:YaiI/YqxD family protein n=1 Tax=Tissierella sp. TaxID=41274 RepID=UPI00285967EC|nr:DUF188 domain-containing protein [Tissierella sp.]MDR7857834.1 DUF188 domain-containing protein [Tissierella sp.]